MHHHETNESPHASSADWMKMMTDFWSPIVNTWEASMKQPRPPSQDSPNDTHASWQTGLQTWLEIFKVGGHTAGTAFAREATQEVPNLLMDFAQSCMRTLAQFQDKVHQWIEKKAGAFPIDDPDTFKQQFLQGWTEAYEKEFRHFFQMPQIGLGRYYQERILNAADKHNLFQAALMKFLQILYLPMEEAFQRLKQHIAEQVEQDQLEADPKTYYQMWIKILEERYMTLFKQPDFSKTVGQTLDALNQYSLAKQAVVNDLLGQYAIPTHQDLDELYQEIYRLKKRMRQYEKQ